MGAGQRDPDCESGTKESQKLAIPWGSSETLFSTPETQ